MKKNVYITEKLKAFLLKEGVYKKFMKNADENSEEDPFERISDAFMWKDTPEGYGYWRKLSDKWKTQQE